MKSVDTNVLVRYLTLDDPEQSALATEVIESAARAGEPLFVSEIVLCELVWVLDAAYRISRSEIVATVDALLRAAHLAFERKARLWQALADFRDRRGDFADYLIARTAAEVGCDATLTFDQKLADSELFDVLG